LSRIQIEIYNILVVKEKEKNCIDFRHKNNIITSSNINNRNRKRKKKQKNNNKDRSLGM